MFAIKRLNLDLYDWICLALLIPITVFAITPSSYGIVLDMFGYHGEGLLWGTPRPIRSDEWSVWTPYMQMAVLNDFTRFNELSTYHQDLRGFNALPLWDWALVFKPFMWPFWIFEPARAFALHHGLIIVAFLIGWKQLTIKCLQDLLPTTKQKIIVASLFSTLLFFTGFVQFWWTTLGPVLAASPWLLLLILKWKNNLAHYVVLGYIAIVWLLSHTYPPVIISVTYFGLLLLCVHKPDWWRSSFKQLFFTAVVCLASVVLVLFYYIDIIPVMMNTVYPGQRISQGGESNWFMWLSTLIPFMTHSSFRNLVGMNICEVGAVVSLLPIVALSFIKPNVSNPVTKRALIGSSILLVVCAMWMLFPIPTLFAKISLLSQIPGNRMLFLNGLVFNYLALVIIVSGDIIVSRKRCVLFIVLLLSLSIIPSALSLVEFGKKSLFELSSLAVLIALISIYQKNKHHNIKSVLILIAVVPNIISFSWFNPAQSAFPIFNLHARKEVSILQSSALKEAPHWVISRDYRGAILSGLGLNSFTSVLIQPQLGLFRKMYPEMSEEEFNYVFNRYGHVSLSIDQTQPQSPFLDVISVPLSDLIPNQRFISAGYNTVNDLNELDWKYSGGSVDDIVEELNRLTIRGWAMSQPLNLLGLFNEEDIIMLANESRLDVSNALGDKRLQSSGFQLVLKNNERTQTIVKRYGVCLFSVDKLYGLRKVNSNERLTEYKCKN